MRLATRALLAALAGLAALAAPAWARVRVDIPAEVMVTRDEIRLGDLGSIEGEEPLAGQVRVLHLGAAPYPGSSRQLDPEYLRLLLRQPPLDPRGSS
jgi:hypothetical protein